MVSVAQLVELRIVIPVVVGSSPIVHPIFSLVPDACIAGSSDSSLLLTNEPANVS